MSKFPERDGATERLSPQSALTMLIIVGVCYMINAMDRIVFSILLPNVTGDYGFSLEQGGLLATVFTLGLGLSGVPTGLAMDRFSRKTVILLGMFVYSVLTIATAFALGFYDMAGYRVLSGLGEGMQNAAAFTAVGIYFYRSRALAIGSMNFAYGLGSFVGPVLAAQILGMTGDWRMPLVAYGLLGLAMMLVALLVLSRRFTEQHAETAVGADPSSPPSIPNGLFHRNVIICCICATGLGVTVYGYIGLYPTFLRTALQFDVRTAGLAASMFGLGAMIGIPAGWLADRFDQIVINLVAIALLAVNAYLLFNIVTSPAGQVLLSFVQGSAASGFFFVNTYALMQRSVRPDFVGRATGLVVTFLYIPAALAGYVFAMLKGEYGWGEAATLQLSMSLAVPFIAMLFFDRNAVRRPRRV
ncbi:MAG TPA: MFS transporter [Bradyrhizobium sp.]|nr:MFS transporter [Bradyrhizobium sp.]